MRTKCQRDEIMVQKTTSDCARTHPPAGIDCTRKDVVDGNIPPAPLHFTAEELSRHKSVVP